MKLEIVNLRQSYYHGYRKNNPSPKVNSVIYLEIVAGFIKYIMSKVLRGHDVKLSTGNSLGTIGVRGRKVKPFLNENGEIKGIAPSWSKTKKLWDENPEAKEKKELVYCFNEHSNGYKYNLIWFRKDMKLHNKSYYYLSFSRANKRALWKLINQGQEYLTVDKT